LVQNDFYLAVFDLVRLIPNGKVTSYGAIARCLGSPQAARMVGYAMNAAHQHDPEIPAHRVVNRMGMLSGKNHFAHITLMQELLEHEGHTIVQDQIQNFDLVFWDPQSIVA